ncbi:MAG: DpnI domain-containing protein [Christensenellales bacterium]|jgi:type II restriction enzyme
MNLTLETNLAVSYKSNSQRVRVVSENWVKNNLYCPLCGNIRLYKFPNNAKQADFYCENCSAEYELKSTKNKFSDKILDGAYSSMIERIQSLNNPNFLFMIIAGNIVNSLCFVPKYVFSPSIIEKRKPLSKKARRAGWVGCNILVSNIPEQGKIYIIKNGSIKDRKVVQQKINIINSINISDIESRGWLMDVLSCVNLIEREYFNLSDIYMYEPFLKKLHPDNNNIRAKIRQQLQILRDKGFIVFLGGGKYRKLYKD